jgi:hypothetical protein
VHVEERRSSSSNLFSKAPLQEFVAFIGSHGPTRLEIVGMGLEVRHCMIEKRLFYWLLSVLSMTVVHVKKYS